MPSRHTSCPERWFIVDGPVDERALAKLPRLTGLLLLDGRRADVRLRTLARTRGLVVAEETRGEAVRVHDLAELRRAVLARAPMILLSPIYPTGSHPDWPAIPKMRAAAMARLARRRLFALGGMDDKRFARIRRLGFQAWAGISAFRT
jgi:thiamine-phosphate pyrophosphorylase